MPTEHKILDKRFDAVGKFASGAMIRITFEAQPLSVFLPTENELALVVADAIATASRIRMRKVSGPLQRLAEWAMSTDTYFTVSDSSGSASGNVAHVYGPKNRGPRDAKRSFERIEKDFGVHKPGQREIDVALDLFFTPEAFLGGRPVHGPRGLADTIGIK